MKIFTVASAVLASTLLLAGMPASADDGAITNKSMSRTIQGPVFDQEVVNNALPEDEHAFTDMMGFYVPAQAASGLVGPIAYCNIDNTPESGEDCTNAVEELEVAKPLVNVFIHGPLFDVEGTAFGHSFMDTYAAVSLDDGETWKQTNLSESADLSSFNLETDHNPSGSSPLPADHNIPLGVDPFVVNHAKGFDTPYSAECTECHGAGLQGTAQTPSCYSCHGEKWSEATPVETGPIVVTAEDNAGTLMVAGVNAAGGADVSILNAVTGGEVGTTVADGDGDFVFQAETELPPCVVMAEYTDNNGEVLTGPSLSVKDIATGEPVENCAGLPVDLNDYPGGTYNVFHAVNGNKVVAGNKVLVAWPSRFCSSGQPAYSMVTESGMEDTTRLTAITEFIRAGSTDMGVPALPGFTSPIDGDAVDDLYLVDAFGVAGNQGSSDFADEGYPQVGVVPFGCVWTARGVLLPGDDPRTDEVEESHMVWTKAERLTSGRRDVNRIEVMAVKGAGFVVTWQEDPEGLRPGQGLGPGEGWSGAVAHSQTDAWYSFINEEYFDIVENPDNTTEPVNILDHDLTTSGRPQVFVPMAIPMRLSNNAKCNPPDTTTSGGGTEDLYCIFEATDEVPVGASAFGLKDQCADTVTIQTGNAENNPKFTEICVADTDGDGVADLPNRANTALTRPRLSLQGYDEDGDGITESAWVIMAAEESKGLGKFFFEPDSDGDGFAEPCEEGSSLTCTEEIGKNQWYYSFDMGTPDTSAGIGDNPNTLVNNLVVQGNLLNQGEVYWETGELFGLMSTEDMDDYGDYNFEILNTEIARRASLLTQSIGKAQNSRSHLLATPSWKQGVMRQGGPADTMLRRIVWDCDTAGDATASASASVQLSSLTTSILAASSLSTSSVETTSSVTTKGKSAKTAKGKSEKTAAVTAAVNLKDAAVKVKDKEHKVDVCHVLPHDRGITINIDESALPAHIAHGDRLGACEDFCDIPQSIEFNPYAFENMVCESYLIEPGTNPYYPGGVCADPAINLSGVVPDTCLNDGTGESEDCPTVDFSSSTYGIGDTNPILQGVVQGEGNQTRVLTWHQCPSDGIQTVGDFTAVTCDTDNRTDDFVNLRDQSWYNPLDVSKGHRGFLDGDFVQFLYAWSPNWRLNAKGNDRYDLYVRRSFDGGETWTTTPGTLQASDGNLYTGNGTVTCESYRPEETTSGERDEPTVCYEFAAGAAEHARNVTQHRSMRITTLDPRFAPTKATIEEGCTDGLFNDPTVIEGIFTCDDLSVDYDSDLRDPSRYFMVYETGDNTTTVVGEAEPLGLYYSRAEGFGDNYVVWTETDTDSADLTVCYPNDPHGDDFVTGTVVEGSGFCNEFDNMNTGGDTHASEANLESNPDGSKLYGVWAQWVFADDDDYDSEIVESDSMARRIWWIDDYVSDTFSYTLPGTQQP